MASLSSVKHFEAGNSIVIGAQSEKRGVYLLLGGIVSRRDVDSTTRTGRNQLYCSTGVLFDEFVSLSSDSDLMPTIHLSFLTHTEMIFVPRDAVKAFYRVHPEVWKTYGRWYQLRAHLKAWAKQKRGQDSEIEPRNQTYSYVSFNESSP